MMGMVKGRIRIRTKIVVRRGRTITTTIKRAIKTTAT